MARQQKVRDLEQLLLEASSDEESEIEDAVLEEMERDARDEREELARAQERGPFMLEDMTEAWCIDNLRFGKEHIHRLATALRLPVTFLLGNGGRVDRVTGLCILLYRLRYPCRLRDIVPVFAMSKSTISRVVKEVMSDIHDRFGELLRTLGRNYHDYEEMARLIGDIAPLSNCLGFIDGTVRSMCRPGKDQQAVYNGHKRCHALKYQSVILPNGIISALHGPYEGRRHDAFLLAESSLMEQMLQLPRHPDGRRYVLYGDPAYPILEQMVGPFRGRHNLTEEQQAFNTAMAQVRASVEYGFNKVVRYFAFADFRANLKLYLQPVGTIYLVSALLTNCHTCLYGQANVNNLFKSEPPTLETYLSVD